MPVFTFSTKTKKPQDTELVESIKKYCDKNKLNFSAVVIDLLKDYKEKLNGQA